MVCARLKIDFVEDLERLAACVSKKFADLGVHVWVGPRMRGLGFDPRYRYSVMVSEVQHPREVLKTPAFLFFCEELVASEL